MSLEKTDNKNMNQDTSNLILVLKALAIYCVVCAHTASVSDVASFQNKMAGSLLNYLGTMGVPVFFVVSGYLFQNNKKAFAEFWKRKLILLFIPWFFCETMLWFYIVIRKGGIGIRQWFFFIIGYKHTTYYLTVLIVFYLIFWWLKKDWQLYMATFISIVSMLSTEWGIGINFLNHLFGTFYLNPLNWMSFFVLGIFISKRKALDKLANIAWRILPFLFTFSVFYFALHENREALFYFSKFSFVGHMINILLFLGIGYGILKCNRIMAIMVLIGRYSFSIYLLHQFVVGFLVKISNYGDFVILTLLRPIITIMIVMMIILIFGKLTSNKVYWMNILMGVR